MSGAGVGLSDVSRTFAVVLRRRRPGIYSSRKRNVGNNAGVETRLAVTRGAEERGTDSALAACINADAVEALLENAKVLAHDEEARGASLKQRAAWLLGFQGVILGLVLTLSKDVANGGWGTVGSPLAAVIALGAVAAILHSARPALKVLDVVQLWHVGQKEVRGYPTYASITKPVTQVRGEMLRGWVRQFGEERAANNGKADALATASRRLTRGFFVLSALVVIACVRAFGI